MNLKKLVLLLSFLGILIAVPMLIFNQDSTKGNVALEQLMLQPDELPPNTNWVTSIAVEADDPRNPIDESIRIGEFVESHHIFVWSPKNPDNLDNSVIIPVINVAFRYATNAEAMAQWQTLVAFMENYEGVKVLASKKQWFNKNKSFSAQFKGEDGEVIHHFVVVKDNVLIFLTVDNIEAIVNKDVGNSFGYELFVDLSEKLLNR